MPVHRVLLEEREAAVSRVKPVDQALPVLEAEADETVWTVHRATTVQSVNLVQPVHLSTVSRAHRVLLEPRVTEVLRVSTVEMAH